MGRDKMSDKDNPKTPDKDNPKTPDKDNPKTPDKYMPKLDFDTVSIKLVKIEKPPVLPSKD